MIMQWKLTILMSTLILLNGCIPRVVSKWDPDVYNGYTVIQGIQKVDTIGHTDVQQREADVLACGVKKLFGGTLDLSVRYPGMTTTQVKERMHRIYDCMKAKGYIIKTPTKCTEDGKPTGFCN